MVRVVMKMLFLAGILLGIPTKIYAGNVSAQLDSTEILLGQPAILRVTLEGSLDEDFEFPQIANVRTELAGNYSQTTIINFKMVTERQLQYRLTANKLGQYTIPALVAKLDGKTEKALPLKFVVSKDAIPGQQQANNQRARAQKTRNQYRQKRANQRQQRQQQQQQRQQNQNAAASMKDAGIVIEKICENKSPFVGQQIKCVTKIYHLDNLRGGSRG